MSTAAPIVAPPARIRRDTSGQRAFLPRALAEAQSLLDAARDAGLARRLIEERLQAMAARLVGSPYWMETLVLRDMTPRDLSSLQDLAHFPTLDRATLAARMADLALLPATEAETDDLVAVPSSGTTGEPVRVLRDRYDCLQMWTALRFWTAWTGAVLPARPRVVLLCSLPGGLEYSARLPVFHDGALHRISLVRPRPLERLRRVRPAVVFTDPEGLHWLGAQDERIAPALVLTSATYLGPDLRAACAARGLAPIINYLSTTETGPIAWECLQTTGAFHVMAPDVWVESVGGELLVTRLRPSVVPLLRYRTGDRGTVDEDACACGARGWTIRGFDGRRACLFRTPKGQPIDAWRLSALFKHHRLRSFRLTQRAASDFLLEITDTTEGDAAGLARTLTTALQDLGWPAPQIATRVLSALPQGEKPEPFRSDGAGPTPRSHPGTTRTS